MLSSSRGMIYKKEKEKNVMKRKKIAIIFGGCSSEYEVSLQSAYAVITHIDQEKYEMVLIGIDQTGVWFPWIALCPFCMGKTGKMEPYRECWNLQESH